MKSPLRKQQPLYNMNTCSQRPWTLQLITRKLSEQENYLHNCPVCSSTEDFCLLMVMQQCEWNIFVKGNILSNVKVLKSVPYSVCGSLWREILFSDRILETDSMRSRSLRFLFLHNEARVRLLLHIVLFRDLWVRLHFFQYWSQWWVFHASPQASVRA